MTRISEEDLKIESKLITKVGEHTLSNPSGEETESNQCETENEACINHTDECTETLVLACFESVNNPCVSNQDCNDSELCNDTISRFMVCCDFTQDPDKNTCDCPINISVDICQETQANNCLISGDCYIASIGCPETEMCLTIRC